MEKEEAAATQPLTCTTAQICFQDPPLTESFAATPIQTSGEHVLWAPRLDKTAKHPRAKLERKCVYRYAETFKRSCGKIGRCLL